MVDDSFLTYVPLISVTIVAALFSIALLNFSIVRKNLQMQSEQQIYARIFEARYRLESTETFTKMAKESPIFAERFTVVDAPDEYYNIAAFLDLFEFLFRLNKTHMIDAGIWYRWKGLAGTMMTIPKFKKVWEKTKQVHTHDFIEFIDSL